MTNRILLIGALLTGFAALALSIDGRVKLAAAQAPTAAAGGGHSSSCSCGNPAAKKAGACGAGCCGGSGGGSMCSTEQAKSAGKPQPSPALPVNLAPAPQK